MAPATKGDPKQSGYEMSLASHVGLGDMPVHPAGRAKCSPGQMHRRGGWLSAILLRKMGGAGARFKKLNNANPFSLSAPQAKRIFW
jgi:hypothetical protein